jgi:putative spermidine/putrescine transport system substrate-binding protein
VLEHTNISGPTIRKKEKIMTEKRILTVLIIFLSILSLNNCKAKAAQPGQTASIQELLNQPWVDIEKQAKEEKEIVFACWADEPGWTQLGKLFTDRYGIEVTLVIGEKIAVMNKTIVELNGVGSIDTMMLAGETVNGLINANALAEGILGKMENKANLVPGLSQRKEGVSNTKQYWVPININPAGFLYNTNNIANPPQTWDEFEAFIDMHPNRFGMCLPEKGGTGQAMMETIIANLTGGLDQYLLDSEVDPVKHAKWQAVWDWIKARENKIVFTNSNADNITRLNGGELDLVVVWNSGLNNAVTTGEIFRHYGFYVPQFGLCYSGDTLAALKNAAHPAAALLWLNWITSEEAQVAAAQFLNYMTARTDISVDVSMLPPGEINKNVDWMSAVYKTQYISDFTKNILQ